MTTKSLCAALVSLLLGASASATPVTVQSVLFDSDNNVLTVGAPLIDPAGNPVSNGAFTILRPEGAADVPVGNGIDEWTRGLFDFRDDSAYGSFQALLAQSHGKLFGATLRLILTPMNILAENDQFNLENGPFLEAGSTLTRIGMQLADNPYLANGISKEVVINLLDLYSQEQLENYVADGRILLTYGDDAIVSGAALTLTANVPEPGTFALFGLGLALAGGLRRRAANRPLSGRHDGRSAAAPVN